MKRAPDDEATTPQSPGEVGETIVVRVEGLAPGGEAVGRQEGGAADGRATFVAYAAPTERVRVRLTRQRTRVAWGELISIEQRSPQRVHPACPLFGRCGGCQWQHVDLQAQRAAKRAIVARALGLTQVPLIAPLTGPSSVAVDGVGYRERARLVVGAKGDIGFWERRSHRVVEVRQCLLLAPPLQAVLEALAATGTPLPTGTEIDLQLGREGVHVTVTEPGGDREEGRLPRAVAAVAALPSRLPEAWQAAGVVGLRVLGRGGTENFGLADVDIAGADEPLSPLRIRAGDFAQVGRAANQALTEVVMREVGKDPGAVLELYAGSGNFTRGLLRHATRVLACEGDPAAVARGRRNASAASWSERPPRVVDADTVLVDPPREGLDGENLQAARQARRRIVYVSCDPQTLGRDAVKLRQAGFATSRAMALDLMPHTYHVEVVATFDKDPACTAISRGSR